jgi:dTDP-4-amino-4,6-dideoxygalactose transaminase
LYRDGLKDIQGIHCLPQTASRTRNHSYFPILVGSDYPLSRDALYQKLKDHGINGRRYFYPLISEFPMYRGLPSSAPSNLPVAADAAKRVLCLPIYPILNTADQQRIIDTIKGS